MNNGTPAGEAAIRMSISRGDFADPVEQRVIQQWLDKQSLQREAAAAISPQALSLRGTIAAERAARWAMYAVLISIAAFLLSAWAYFRTMK